MSEEIKPCIDHLDFIEENCPDCGLEVDRYGNTEDQFDYCPFPNCGCDGARLCIAKEGPSEDANELNVEGMWSSKKSADRLRFIGEMAKRRSVGEEGGEK